MSLNTLLKSLDQYLNDQRQIDNAGQGAKPAESSFGAIDALKRLEDELRVFGEERAGGLFKTILVAVDGSEPSHRAIHVAGRLAEEVGASLVLVHVVNTGLGYTPEFAFADVVQRPALLEQGDQFLQRARSLLPGDVRVEQVLREGDPSAQIVSVAQVWKPDLIVIGTHGRGRIAHFLLGSTAESVVRHAPCPVLTVGHEYEREEQEESGAATDKANASKDSSAGRRAAPEPAHAGA